jgi:hypothetical protein
MGIKVGIDLWSREKSLPLTEIEEGFFDRLGVVYKLRDSKSSESIFANPLSRPAFE